MLNTQKVRKLILLLAVALLQSCLSMKANTAEQMLGKWQSKVGDFPIVIEYREATVKIGENAPVSYKLEGDQLIFTDSGAQIVTISFTNKNEMIHQNQLTGTQQILTRISP
ncbi:MAG: hypothetical protein ACI9CE_002688 [Flavobacterium sp.]|jgi:hypothetical protein